MLRAAEQGEGEARETLVALAGEGRGVTEHNYVDLAALVRVAPNVAQGQFLGRTLFRTLSRGQVETVLPQLYPTSSIFILIFILLIFILHTFETTFRSM